MSSANEEISAPPKPKTSPLEFRNTDLVSRLLAATPPYLYNMPLVPHSYFFSEMLRSLVQGKAEAAARMPATAAPHRRSRKRTWSHARTDHYAHKQQMSPNTKPDSIEMPPPNWTPKMPTDKSHVEMFDTKVQLVERPLELTMNKISMNNGSKQLSHCHTDMQATEVRLSPTPKCAITSAPNLMLSPDKSDIQHPTLPTGGHVPMMFPPIPNLSPQETSSSSSDLILPPPPPIWYPPLYPTPYGIDPLHFFIDLRVSGHIYDRKNSKEHATLNMNLPHGPPNPPMNHLGNALGHVLDMNSGNANSTITSSSSAAATAAAAAAAAAGAGAGSVSENMISFNNMNRESLVKQSRHASAFSVPTPSLARNDPLNLSGANRYHSQSKIHRYGEEKCGKFDIKSMGFDTNPAPGKNTNYIFKNLTKIYRDIHDTKHEREVEEEGIDLTRSPRYDSESREDEVNVKDEVADSKQTTDKDEDKEKKCKDLRALIGLELVVDYVKHEVKPTKHSTSEGSITDMESNVGSPAVEVVTIHDIDNSI